MLLDRNHSRYRWENQPAVGVRLENLDREEILSTRAIAIKQREMTADALRIIILNAVIHRDVSNPSSYVALAVLDDRIEIHSIGGFPSGIRAEMLTQEHPSIPRNPLIAGAFHRTGAIEVWGRGTNRVVDACIEHGIAEPTFSETAGAVFVKFKAMIVADGPLSYQYGSELGPRRDQAGTMLGLSWTKFKYLKLRRNLSPCRS